MKILFLTICMWQATLLNQQTGIERQAYLKQKPKIGKGFHFNGEIWKVIEVSPRKVCK